MKMEDLSNEKDRQEAIDGFTAIPADRTFYQVKLYLNEEGEPTGQCLFDVAALRQQGVSNSKLALLNMISRMVGQSAQRAIDRMGQVYEVFTGLGLDELFDKEEEEKSGQSEQPAKV